jgi:hypothetical protein
MTLIDSDVKPQTEGVATRPRYDRALAVGLFLLAGGAGAVALLGPLVFGAIDYHASEAAIGQVKGGDVAGLVLVAPISLIAGILVWRGHVAGPVLALGPAVYGLYMYSQLALGGDVSRYPGNSEMYFLLFLGLFVLAGAVAIVGWRTIDTDALPETSRRLDKTFGWFTLVVAVFLALGLHLRGLVDVWAGDPGSEYLADPVVFWLVKFMDLGLVVPVLLLVGIGVLRGAGWAVKAEYAAAGWIALLGASVAGMAIVMQVTGDPAASIANTVVFSLFALIAMAMAVLVYRPLFRSSAP